ncbi:MAG: Zn-ribbon domain-containing OB-fold protein [Chloroflexi bacterium]|nr:Zn-ribbon domain-containing OB-fold protein [Chloroflexota bacterium]
MATDHTKPLPVAQPESDHYWEQAANGKLVLQRCSDCGEAQFYPRVMCIHCGSRSIEWIESSGRATLFTFAIVHVPPHPGFRGDVPYVTAIVELEEGVRMPSQVIGIEPDPDQLRIGMPLQVVFDQVTDDVALPKFRPVE